MLTTDIFFFLCLSVCLSLCFSLSPKENKFKLAFYLFLDLLVGLNENYRYETRPKKEKSNFNCMYLFQRFSGKQRKRYWDLWKGSLKLTGFSKNRNRISNQGKPQHLSRSPRISSIKQRFIFCFKEQHYS